MTAKSANAKSNLSRSLANQLDVLADKFRRLQSPQQLSRETVAREVDVTLPAMAGQILLQALDAGLLAATYDTDHPCWDLRHFSPQWQDKRVAERLGLETSHSKPMPMDTFAFSNCWWGFIRGVLVNHPEHRSCFRSDWPGHWEWVDALMAGDLNQWSREDCLQWPFAGRDPEVKIKSRLRASADIQGTACEVLAIILESHGKTEKPQISENTGTNPGNEDKTETLIAALVEHHEFDGSSVGNPNWIGCQELATAAGTVKSTASKFFKRHFRTKRNDPKSGS